MSVWEYVVGGIIILLSLVIIAIVLLQQGRESNLGVISGAADTFFDKGRARTADIILPKITRILAIVFFVVVLGGMILTKVFA